MKTLLLCLLASAALLPQAPPYSLGDKVEDFSLINAVDNQRVALSDYADQKGVVIIFSSHNCPYSKLYEDRIIKLAQEFGDKQVSFILVNPNSIIKNSGEDSREAMAKRAKEKSYTFPYLVDDGATNLYKRFEASRTPECFVLKNIDSHFIIHYHGAIDDNPQEDTDVSNHYLRDALTGLTNDNAIRINEKQAVGCVIRKY